MTARSLVALLASAALLMPSIAPAVGLSGSATMRVEVDVYKGPVGQTLEAQLGELSALLAQAARAANHWTAEARALAKDANLRCTPATPNAEATPKADCAILYQGLSTSAEVVNSICRLNGLPSRFDWLELRGRILANRGFNTRSKPNDPSKTNNRPIPTADDIRKADAEVSSFLERGKQRLILDQQIYRSDGSIAAADGCNPALTMLPTAENQHPLPTKGPVAPPVPLAIQNQVRDAARLELQACLDKLTDRELTDLSPPSPPDISCPANYTRLGDTALGSQPDTGLFIRGRQDFVRRVAVISSSMQIEARRLASTNVAYVPRDKRVRSKMAELGMLFGDFAQNIGARNSTIAKIIKNCADEKDLDDCSPEAKLPTGDYLRDVAPSRYLEAFRWFNASIGASGTGAYRRNNRINAIEALTEDYHWERVNEVYASGQGDVGMAFIKDELGNWNLKSFSNDPTELLRAYRKGTDAAISAAVSLARKAAGDPRKVMSRVTNGKSLLDLADRFSSGSSSNTDLVGGASLSRLRQRTVSRLNALKTRLDERKTTLKAVATGNSSAPEGSIAEAEEKLSGAEGAVTIARGDLEKAEGDLLNSRNACGANCTPDQFKTYEMAVTARDMKQSVLVTAEIALRTAASEVDRRKSELSNLGKESATAAAIILQDHESDLASLTEATSPPANETTVPDPIQ